MKKSNRKTLLSLSIALAYIDLVEKINYPTTPPMDVNRYLTAFTCSNMPKYCSEYIDDFKLNTNDSHKFYDMLIKSNVNTFISQINNLIKISDYKNKLSPSVLSLFSTIDRVNFSHSNLITLYSTVFVELQSSKNINSHILSDITVEKILENLVNLARNKNVKIALTSLKTMIYLLMTFHSLTPEDISELNYSVINGDSAQEHNKSILYLAICPDTDSRMMPLSEDDNGTYSNESDVYLALINLYKREYVT